MKGNNYFSIIFYTFYNDVRSVPTVVDNHSSISHIIAQITFLSHLYISNSKCSRLFIGNPFLFIDKTFSKRFYNLIFPVLHSTILCTGKQCYYLRLCEAAQIGHSLPSVSERAGVCLFAP